MDASTLKTIVVTTVITVTVTTIIQAFWKEALPPIAKTLKQTAKITFTRKVMMVAKDIFLLCMSGYFLNSAMRKDGPITRWNILEIVFWYTCMWGTGLILMFSIGQILAARSLAKEMARHKDS